MHEGCSQTSWYILLSVRRYIFTPFDQAELFLQCILWLFNDTKNDTYIKLVQFLVPFHSLFTFDPLGRDFWGLTQYTTIRNRIGAVSHSIREACIKPKHGMGTRQRKRETLLGSPLCPSPIDENCCNDFSGSLSQSFHINTQFTA